MRIKTIYQSIALVGSLGLVGCGATSALISHSSLDVNSKMSDTIFLDPEPANHQTVFLQVKNTTSEDLKGITTELTTNFTNAGWTVVKDQSKAYNMVQVNVLQAGEAQDPDAVWKTVQSGYGAAALGGLAGLAVGYGTGSVVGGLGAGLGVATVSWVADSAIKNVAYSVITDIQISVKTNGKVSNTQQASLKQGTSTVQHQTATSTGNWLKYQTRIGTVAQKVNLKFPDAKPVIVKQLGQQISNIFISNE